MIQRHHTCCLDMDIDPVHLVLPWKMDLNGQKFVQAHGLSEAKLVDLQTGAVLMDNGQVKIFHRCQHLDEVGLCRIYPDRPDICRDYQCGDDKCPPVGKNDDE